MAFGYRIAELRRKVPSWLAGGAHDVGRRRGRLGPVVQEHVVVTITDVALAARVERAADGSVTSILDRVGSREEFVLGALPALQKLWLIFLFDNALVPGGFHVAVEVRTYRDKVATFDSGTVESAAKSGQVPIEVPFLVSEVGPQTIWLSIDGHKVWEQVVFFALSA